MSLAEVLSTRETESELHLLFRFENCTHKNLSLDTKKNRWCQDWYQLVQLVRVETLNWWQLASKGLQVASEGLAKSYLKQHPKHLGKYWLCFYKSKELNQDAARVDTQGNFWRDSACTNPQLLVGCVDQYFGKTNSLKFQNQLVTTCTGACRNKWLNWHVETHNASKLNWWQVASEGLQVASEGLAKLGLKQHPKHVGEC